jgi:hypothetical protein
MANCISHAAIGHTFDLEFNVHHRSAHSTNAGGASFRTTITRTTRSSRSNSAAPARAVSMAA